MNRLLVPLAPLLLLASCWPAGAKMTAAWPKVGVVGDSLVYQAEYGPTSEVPEYDDFLSDALEAERTRPLVSAKSSTATKDLSLGWGWFPGADVYVIGVGTNDVINMWVGSTTLAQSTRNLDAQLARTDADCNVIVGVVETPFRHMDVWGDDWNRAVRARADVFVDWWAIARQHPEYLVSDQTHHTAAGQEAYRQAIVDGVKRCP